MCKNWWPDLKQPQLQTMALYPVLAYSEALERREGWIDQERELALACQPNAAVIKNKPLEIKYLEIISILAHSQYELINSYN